MGQRQSNPSPGQGKGSAGSRENGAGCDRGEGLQETVRRLERCLMEVGPCPDLRGPQTPENLPGKGAGGGESGGWCPFGRFLRWVIRTAVSAATGPRGTPPHASPRFRSEVKAGAVMYAPRSSDPHGDPTGEPAGSGGKAAEGRRWVVVCLGSGNQPTPDAIPHPAVARALERGAYVIVPGAAPGSASIGDCVEYARAQSPPGYGTRTAVLGVSEGALRACMLEARGAMVASVANPYEVADGAGAAGGGVRSCLTNLARSNSPTLIVNLLGSSPQPTEELVRRAEAVARREGNFVCSVTVPPGLSTPAAHDWAYRLALEFCLGD